MYKAKKNLDKAKKLVKKLSKSKSKKAKKDLKKAKTAVKKAKKVYITLRKKNTRYSNILKSKKKHVKELKMRFGLKWNSKKKKWVKSYLAKYPVKMRPLAVKYKSLRSK